MMRSTACVTRGSSGDNLILGGYLLGDGTTFTIFLKIQAQRQGKQQNHTGQNGPAGTQKTGILMHPGARRLYQQGIEVHPWPVR